MRYLLTKDEIHRLVAGMPEEATLWQDKDNDRKERYRKTLADADPGELIQMLRTVYRHKQQRLAEGKRLHVVDESFLKEAEEILYNEFRYVLQMENKEALMEYILFGS